MSINVAIVEDENELRESLRILINGSEGFSCRHTFSNAEDAIRELPEIHPDIILTDIHLPGKSGIDLISELKSVCPKSQFLVCTSFEDSETVFKALKAGAAGYLVKTLQPSKLLDAIIDLHNGGSPMSSHIARKVVGSFKEIDETENYQKLSPREQELLQYLSQGLRYKEIADKLGISTETVRKHIRNIYAKLEVNSRTEALNRIYSRS